MHHSLTLVLDLDIPMDDAFSPAVVQAITEYAAMLTARQSNDLPPFEQNYVESGALITSVGV